MCVYVCHISNYNDSEKKTTGGRNGYGAKLANIFSTEFTVETCDGARSGTRVYLYVFIWVCLICLNIPVLKCGEFFVAHLRFNH